MATQVADPKTKIAQMINEIKKITEKTEPFVQDDVTKTSMKLEEVQNELLLYVFDKIQSTKKKNTEQTSNLQQMLKAFVGIFSNLGNTITSINANTQARSNPNGSRSLFFDAEPTVIPQPAA